MVAKVLLYMLLIGELMGSGFMMVSHNVNAGFMGFG